MNNQLIETRFYNSPKGHTYQVNFYPLGHLEIIDPIEGTHNESDKFWLHAYYPEVMNDLIDEPLHTTSRDIYEAKQAEGAKLHIKETHVDKVYGRIFEGWMSGSYLNKFVDLAHTHCAMTSSQAIAYKCEVERVAFQKGIEVEVIYDFLA